MARGWRFTNYSLVIVSSLLRAIRVRVCAMHPFYYFMGSLCDCILPFYILSGFCSWLVFKEKSESLFCFVFVYVMLSFELCR